MPTAVPPTAAATATATRSAHQAVPELVVTGPPRPETAPPAPPALVPPPERPAPTPPFDHGRRSELNARFFDRVDRYANRVARDHKAFAFRDLEVSLPDHVVELGPGVGANLGYLPAGTRLTAVEPNLAMHPALRARAADRDISLEVLAQGAERLPFPDGSVDVVIATLVLCTVGDPDAVLAEVRRVLRPGGTFRFVEHVAAPAWSPRSWLQHALRRPWRWAFEGCDLHRRTADAIVAAGFRQVDLLEQRLRGSVFTPVNTAIAGVAVR